VITGFANDSGTVGDHITSDTTLTINGTAEANSTVTVFQNGGSIGTATADGSGNWSKVDSNTLVNGTTYQFTATQTDVAGNTSVATANYAATIDTAAPAAPTGLSYNNSGSNHKLSGNAEANATVNVYADLDNSNTLNAGDTLIGTGSAAGNGNFAITVSTYSGSHNLLATATDAAGNVSSAGITNPATSWPAGVAGEPINLALTDPSADHVGAVTVTIAGVPAGWTLSEGTHNADGTWTVQTSNIAALAITSPTDYTGTLVLNVAESWTNADGSTGNAFVSDNVEVYAQGATTDVYAQGATTEVYAQGATIFAWSGNDTLTGSSGDDLFVFSQPIGNDTVHNFDVAHDKIDLIHYAGFQSFADVQAHLANDAAGNALITLGDGQSITLSGVDAGALSAGDFVFDQTPVLNNAGSLVISDGAMMPFSGIINNSGTIALDSTGNATELELIQYGITLQGGGQFTLSDSGANAIFGTAPSVIFTNVDNTISGAGQLGAGQMTLDNHGTILANGANALVIDTGSNIVTNSGTLEASGSGGLVIDSALLNLGSLWADGGNITLHGAVSGSGSAMISGVATLEFGAASDQHVIFDSSAAGTLKLDAGSNFSGSVSGFDGNDTLDLRDLLAGEHSGGSEANLADYLNFTAANGGADTVIQVSTHGGGAAGVDQTFVLQGVDVTTLGADESAIIGNLLAANKLLVDA
jgi:hypothetical protein